MIQVKKLIHSYLRYGKTEQDTQSVRALNGLDLQILPGQMVAIVGRNGSGKSTLAKHLNALLLPQEGTVEIDGQNTCQADCLHQIRKTVAMVFQNPDNQIVGTTVEEDVAFGLENMQVPAQDMHQRIDESLKAVDLLAQKQMESDQLSGGQKQKTAIAGAIAVLPKCLVLDEATAMLDPKARREVMQIAKTLNRKHGITVILVTHHMDEVVDADWIFLMEQGAIAAQGTPQELFAVPKLLANCGLELPRIAQFAIELKEQGLNLQLPILTEEELVNQLTVIAQRQNHEN